MHSRGLIDPDQAEAAMRDNGKIEPFQNAQSCRQPAVDPTGAVVTNITMPEPPLRVCLLSTTYPPTEYDGIGRHTNLIARGLFELGHSVHVVTLGDREQVSFYEGAYVHRINYSLDRYQRFRQYPNLVHALNYGHAVQEKVRRLMLNDGVEVVDSPLWLFPGLVSAIGRQLPVVVRLQTGQRQVTAIQRDESNSAAIMGDMERALIRMGSHLVPNSLATVAAIQKVYELNIPADRMTLIPHGIVPVAEAETRPFDPRRAAQELTVLFVGRLEKRKGVRALFEAIPTVLERAPNARFLLAGADNSHFDGFEQEVGMNYPAYFAARHPSLAGRVIFKGSVSDEELQKLYQGCDLFVAPSLYESFGLVYLEAMNYAKPVIGCRAGGIPEVVEDGVTGWLVEPDDSRDLAGAMICALSAPKQLEERGIAGRQRLLSRFTHTQMAREFAKVYAHAARQESHSVTAIDGRSEWRGV
jgi:glycogen synthase